MQRGATDRPEHCIFLIRSTVNEAGGLTVGNALDVRIGRKELDFAAPARWVTATAKKCCSALFAVQQLKNPALRSSIGILEQESTRRKQPADCATLTLFLGLRSSP